MYKFSIAIKKEFLILWSDKAGLALMFFMPVLLVFIITIIQDSAFKIVNENKITLVISNNDQGEQGDRLISLLEESKFFTISKSTKEDSSSITQSINKGKYLTGLIIPPTFSDQLILKSSHISDILMKEISSDTSEDQSSTLNMPSLKFYHDPVLQENYCSSIINIINAFVKTIEGDLLIGEICNQLELTKAPEKLKEALVSNQVQIERHTSVLSSKETIPNSTQHNVPAWTIFAIFFMVISLGNNIVKERLNGSFLRLKTMPTSFFWILMVKLFVYLIAVYVQVFLVFGLAKATFPLIGLPELVLPENVLAFFVLVSLTALAAISFATAAGSIAYTQEQANGFGAIAIVLFAAIGGIWVPSFVMPDYIRVLSYGSPLYWSLEGFYTLFLRGGSWIEILPKLLGLILFSLSCFGLSFWKLKKDRII